MECLKSAFAHDRNEKWQDAAADLYRLTVIFPRDRATYISKYTYTKP